jgi:hypothetical protein
MKIENNNILTIRQIKDQILISKTYLKTEIPKDYLEFFLRNGYTDIEPDKNGRFENIGGLYPSNEEVLIWKFDGYQIPFFEDPEYGFYILNLRKLENGKAPVYILSNERFVTDGYYPEYSLVNEGLDYNKRSNEPDYSKDSSYFYPTKYKSFDEWLAAIDDEDFKLIL